MSGYVFSSIGRIESCYKEKFGIPRQPGLVARARARILVPRTPENEAALRDLEKFSHIWVVFVFHGLDQGQETRKWRPTVRPPRLKGKTRVGVYTTRSPHRPNPIGISAVQMDSVTYDAENIVVTVIGGDFLDGTPVLDIKPYLAYCDSIPKSVSDWAEGKPEALVKVDFTLDAESDCTRWEGQGYPGLRTLIQEVLELDPRPAFQKIANETKEFACKLSDFDVRWTAQSLRFQVFEVKKLTI